MLAILQIGDDPAASVYIRSLLRYGEQTGVEVRWLRYPESISTPDAIDIIDGLNGDPGITAVMLATPMPDHIKESELVIHLSPKKDIEGIHPYNLGLLMAGMPGVKPATPKSALSIIKAYGISLTGKKVVLLGRSMVVGLPLANMLIRENATVTVCHSLTRNLSAICRNADILISAVGKIGFVNPEMVADNAVVIDIGTNMTPEGKLVGDVAPAVYDKVYAVTPVPGGVGTLTVVEMFDNFRYLVDN